MRTLIRSLYDDERPGAETVRRALRAVRAHLDMEVAYVSEFVDDRSVFREVDAPGLEALVKVGDSYSLDDVYCRHILEGRLPELIPDTASEPVAVAMPITKAVPIGSHISVPLRLPDGRPYGMFCCLSTQPDHSLNQRDLQMMKAFADLAAFEISREIEARRAQEERTARIREVIDRDQLCIVYQPIWRVATLRPAGLEALTRFTAEPERPPDEWFNEAASVGLGSELELAALRKALAILPQLPLHAYLALNASPETMLSDAFPAVFEGLAVERLVLEVTEHMPVADYSEIRNALQPLRDRGLRIAVDDAGAGYSSFRHILQLQPNLIKLDTALTRGIDSDPAKRALGAALVVFARETGTRIVAEGVEAASELDVLKALGVDKAQGYFLGRPLPAEEALAHIGEGASASQRVA